MAIMTKIQAETMGRNTQAAGFSRAKALRHAPADEELQAVFMDAYDSQEPAPAPDDEITNALMSLLEAKLAAFMGRTDLSDSPPEDKVAIRAGYFLGVAAGMQLANSISGADGETAAAALDHDKDCDLFKQVRGIDSPKMHCTCKDLPIMTQEQAE